MEEQPYEAGWHGPDVTPGPNRVTWSEFETWSEFRTFEIKYFFSKLKSGQKEYIFSLKTF